MGYIIKMKSGKTFNFSLASGTIETVQKDMNKNKFIKIDTTLINVNEIEYIEPK